MILTTACQTTGQLPLRQARTLTEMVDRSAVFSRSFTGFALYDPSEQRFLHQSHADKYFTPASNTKIFTFYTALKILGDSLPLLHYAIDTAQASLAFWGTGNPLLFHPDFKQDTVFLEWLKNRQEKLYFSDHNYRDERFGPGWAWGDYAYAYQVEKAPLPLYGGLVSFGLDTAGPAFRTDPALFGDSVRLHLDWPEDRPRVERQERSNIIGVNRAFLNEGPVGRTVPFTYSRELISGLLSQALGRHVALSGSPPSAAGSTYAIPMPDTMLRRFMQQSDNFIAEQLLLLCADKRYGVMNSGQLIAYARDTLLAGAPDPLQWVDGSGLSRYNLFTPRTIVYVLDQLWRDHPHEWLTGIFPAGGRSGTIRSWYGGPGGQPFVFAKTGTLRHKHCLSGYLHTKKDRWLIFSFMHNNFTGSSDPLKAEMDKILRWIYDNL